MHGKTGDDVNSELSFFAPYHFTALVQRICI